MRPAFIPQTGRQISATAAAPLTQGSSTMSAALPTSSRASLPGSA